MTYNFIIPTMTNYDAHSYSLGVNLRMDIATLDMKIYLLRWKGDGHRPADEGWLSCSGEEAKDPEKEVVGEYDISYTDIDRSGIALRNFIEVTFGH